MFQPNLINKPVFAYEEKFGPITIPYHTHRHGQFLYAREGLFTVNTNEGFWVIPAQCGIWIPAYVSHQVSSQKGFWMCTIYVNPKKSFVPSKSIVVSVDNLLHALFIKAATFGPNFISDSAEERLMQVILDLIPRKGLSYLCLQQPTDLRLKKFTKILENNISQSLMLSSMAASVGITIRHLTRLFVKETGMTPGKWRQRLRLLKALQLLGSGEQVSTAALKVGYQDVSSFICVFKNYFGATPIKYIISLRDSLIR